LIKFILSSVNLSVATITRSANIIDNVHVGINNQMNNSVYKDG